MAFPETLLWLPLNATSNDVMKSKFAKTSAQEPWRMQPVERVLFAYFVETHGTISVAHSLKPNSVPSVVRRAW